MVPLIVPLTVLPMLLLIPRQVRNFMIFFFVQSSRRHIEQLPSSASTGAGAHGKNKDRVKKKLNFDKAAAADDDDDDSTAGHAPD